MGAQLSQQQTQAVRAEGHLLVSSCPGSGKTTVLSHRAEHLLVTHPNARVGAVTFTADAADELSSRIRKRVGQGIRRLTAGTFHKLAIGQLRAANVKIDLMPEFRCRDIIREAHLAYAANAFRLEETAEAISTYKSQPDYPLPSPDQDVRVLAYRYYEKRLHEAGKMDFADLLLRSVYGMRNGDVAALDVSYLLVDEAQDLDAAQLEWVRAHVLAGTLVTCVGDDDQAVYGFRQSLGYAGMRRFVETSRASEIILDTTYRCAPEVLSVAAQLIGRNKVRIPKRLRTESSLSGSVAMQGHETRESEYKSLIESVLANGPPESWGILARTNSLLDTFEEEMARAFPYTRVGGESVWDRVGPQLMLSVLSAIADNTFSGVDTLLSRCGVSTATVDLVADIVQPRVRSSLMRFIGLRNSDLGIAKGDLVCELRDRLNEWTAQVDRGQLTLAANAIAHFIANKVRWGRAPTSSAKRITAELVRLERCGNRIAREKGSLSDVLTRIRCKDKAAGGGARLMTLHASKGLEFDRVWIMGAEQGVIPSSKGDLEEERRLMYVGMTRARAWLMVSYCRENGAKASDFIEEAGIFI